MTDRPAISDDLRRALAQIGIGFAAGVMFSLFMLGLSMLVAAAR